MQVEKQTSLSETQIVEAARLFRTLSEPARLRVVKALMGGPLTVGELVTATGMKQGNVSKHLGILRAAEMVNRERQGNFIRYSISDPCLYDLCALVCGKLERDARHRLAELTTA